MMTTAKEKDTAIQKTPVRKRKKTSVNKNVEKIPDDISKMLEVPQNVKDAIESITKKFEDKGYAIDLIQKILQFESIRFRFAPTIILGYCDMLEEYLDGKKVDINYILDMAILYTCGLNMCDYNAQKKAKSWKSNQTLTEKERDERQKFDQINKIIQEQSKKLDDISNEISEFDKDSKEFLRELSIRKKKVRLSFEKNYDIIERISGLDKDSPELRNFRRNYYNNRKNKNLSYEEFIHIAIKEELYSNYVIEDKDGNYSMGKIPIKER